MFVLDIIKQGDSMRELIEEYSIGEYCKDAVGLVDAAPYSGCPEFDKAREEVIRMCEEQLSLSKCWNDNDTDQVVYLVESEADLECLLAI